MNEPTLAEKEAILLRWHAQNPTAPPGSTPSPEQSEQLLAEIREHVAGIEQETMSMLMSSLRVRPTGGGSPVSRLVFVLFAALVVLGGVAAAIASLFHTGRTP